MKIDNRDTSLMTVDEIKNVIDDLRKIRARKERQFDYAQRMNALILDASENGFTFIDRDFGFVRTVNDFKIIDTKT